MKAQFAVIFQRIFRPTERTVRHRQPVHQPGEQKAHGRAARESRQRIPFRPAKRTHLSIRVKQRPALCDVVRMIRLEAPGIEADGHVIGERIGAGKIEVDETRELVAEEEHIIRKKIGVDDALRQRRAARSFPAIQLLCNFRTKALPHAIAARFGLLVKRPPAFNRECVGALEFEIRARQMQPRERLADRGAVAGTGTADPQPVEKSHDRRRPAGDFAEHAALLVFHRLRTGNAARRQMLHQRRERTADRCSATRFS